MTLRFAVVGYGFGGRSFHSPYLAVAPGCEMAGVVTTSDERAAQVREDLPGAQVFPSMAAAKDAGVEAVAISTPPHTRREVVLEAIALGLHVIADKPFAPTVAEAEEMTAAAREAGVLLNVFHNRRYDTDAVTASKVLAGGELGAIHRLEVRFDQDAPGLLKAGPGSGLLWDLGSHLIDRALDMCGPATHVTGFLDYADFPSGRTDVSWVVALRHASGAHSHLSASRLVGLDSHEMRILGEHGSYVSNFSDVQTEDVLAGRLPTEDASDWGFEAEERWGTLTVDASARAVPSEQGDYRKFYSEFAEAVQAGGPGPVPADQGIATLAVLEAARESSDAGVTIELRQ